MKTFIHFIFTCLVSTFAFFGVLGSKNPWPGLAVAFGIWAIFVWRYWVRTKREVMKRRYDEQMFREHMRFKNSGSRR